MSLDNSTSYSCRSGERVSLGPTTAWCQSACLHPPTATGSNRCIVRAGSRGEGQQRVDSVKSASPSALHRTATPSILVPPALVTIGYEGEVGRGPSSVCNPADSGCSLNHASRQYPKLGSGAHWAVEFPMRMQRN